MAERWFVASVQPGLSETAQRSLKLKEISSYFIRVRDLNGRIISYFPGYIFVTINTDYLAETANAINGTRGIGRLLPGHLESPLALPRGFVEDLKEAAEAGRLDERVEEMIEKYQCGEAVKVRSGPWIGTAFEVTRYRKGSLAFFACLLGKQVEVFIPQHQVEKIPDTDRITNIKAIRCPQYRPRLRAAAALRSV